MKTALRRLSPALVVLFCGGLLPADAQNPPTSPAPQTTQQKPVFRTGVDMVRVDVYPRRNGKVVEGLAREDFQLTEDGVRQTIETFEFISIETDRALEPLDPRSSSEARRMAADPRNRVFVFYLDTYKIDFEGGARAREPLLGFLQRSMGPRDLFAWMTPKQSPEYLEFTRMTQELSSVMTFAKPWGQMNQPVDDPKEMELQACAPGPPNGGPNWLVQRMRDLEFLTDMRELFIRLGALRTERKNVVILGERWQTVTGLPPRLTSAPAAPVAPDGPFAPVQRGRGSFTPPPSPVIEGMKKCAEIEMYLNRQDFREMTRTLPELARRHNIALYFVSLAPKTLFNFSLARSFAEETDGRSMVSNDIAGSLQQVLDHQTGFYMLGYRSTAGEAGKKERAVRVKTTKPGVELDVRRIYQPPPDEFVAARSLSTPPVERSDVQKAIDRLPPLRDDLEFAIHAVRRSAFLDVTVELMPRLASNDPWRSGARTVISLLDPGGAELATAESSFAAGDRSARVRMPVDESRPPARMTARIFHAGGAALRDSAAIEAVQPAPIGPPIFYRAGSLPRLPFQPAALLTFGRTERVRVEWPIAGEVADPAVRLLNGGGQPLATDAAVAIADGVLRADLRLLSLAPGEYVIEAAGLIDGKPARHLVAIRVTR